LQQFFFKQFALGNALRNFIAIFIKLDVPFRLL